MCVEEVILALEIFTEVWAWYIAWDGSATVEGQGERQQSIDMSR
jgi:hypothetical protein